MKIFLVLLVLSLGVQLYAQSDKVETARMEFEAGNYEDAIGLYNGAIVTAKDEVTKKKLTEERTIAGKCHQYKIQGETYYNQGRYSQALDAYQNVVMYNPHDEYAKRRLAQCRSELMKIARKQNDNKLWEKAKLKNDIQAYRDYIHLYPDGGHLQEAKNAVIGFEEEEKWNAARMENTLKSYTNYLAQSKLLKYQSEAELKICQIKDDEKWDAIKYSFEVEVFKSYVNDHLNPCKQHAPEAWAKIHRDEAKNYLNKAESYYRAGNYREAANAVKKAQEMAPFTSDMQTQADKYMEAYDYSLIRNSRSYSALQEFLKKYPNSPNRAEVQKSFNKVNRKLTRKVNGSDRFQMGIGADLDVYTMLSFSAPKIRFKIGEYDNLFNFSFGVQYTHYWGGKRDGGDAIKQKSQLYVTADQLSIPVFLKFNICDVGYDSKFYLAGGGCYNFNFSGKYIKKDKDFDGNRNPVENIKEKGKYLVHSTNYSLIGEAGFAWKHCELGFFYRYDMQPLFDQQYFYENLNYEGIKQKINNRFRFGMSVIVYFAL